jgi:LacI family transcriptional regulator
MNQILTNCKRLQMIRASAYISDFTHLFVRFPFGLGMVAQLLNLPARSSMQKNRATPTLDDVARDAGVSTATVSRCLNLPDRVAKATLDKVKKSIENLGYTPNFGARVMAARRTFTIGAIIPTMENAIFARGIQAFQEELNNRGYTLLVSSTGYDPEVEEDQIKALVARGADGLLLIGYDRIPAIYEYLERQNVPTLLAWAFSEDHPQTCIGFDNRAAMRTLAERVIALGHERIGIISGITQGNDRATERLNGILDALQNAGRDPLASPVIKTPYEIQNGSDALDKLLTIDPRLTAVMCANDVLAVGAVRRAKEIGLDVPTDLSITGFDDIELAQVVAPALTTVHVPHRKMGRKAAYELVQMVEGSSTGVSLKLETFIQNRSSLASPQRP